MGKCPEDYCPGKILDFYGSEMPFGFPAFQHNRVIELISLAENLFLH